MFVEFQGVGGHQRECRRSIKEGGGRGKYDSGEIGVTDYLPRTEPKRGSHGHQ